jgi:hypothetical protein
MIVVAVAVIVFGTIALSSPRRRPFDPVAWGAGEKQPEREWEEMADDLVASRALLGKTRSEVVALLGEPPPTGYFRSFDLVYRLGMERRFISIDSEWLVLRLGPDGRVIECKIVTD